MGNIEMMTIYPPEKSGIVEYHLTAGNKHLLVSLNRTSAFAETELTNTEGDATKGTTTELYNKAKELLRIEARTYGSITYQVSTGFKTMKEWTATIGNSIFHWERTYQSIDDPEKLIAETTIPA